MIKVGDKVFITSICKEAIITKIEFFNGLTNLPMCYVDKTEHWYTKDHVELISEQVPITKHRIGSKL